MSKYNTTAQSYRDFYDELPEINSFAGGLQGKSAALPHDWYVVMTDVVSSTQAIENGRYKTVNIAGALPIIAIARIYGTLKRPFVFGGDGMTFLVDPQHIDEVRLVLSRVLRDIGDLYGLEMRAAAIPASQLHMRDAQLMISKVRVSSQYVQAFFHGGGILMAEEMLKGDQGESYAIAPATDRETVNYDGFTCRWADVPSHTGITAAIIVEPRGDQDPMEILGIMEEVLGADGDYHPLRIDNMRMGGAKSAWTAPFLAKSHGRKNLAYFIMAAWGWFEIFVARIMYTLGIPLQYGIYNLGKAREQNIENSDFRKYEGALKMIVALDDSQLEDLRARLEKKRLAGSVFYGIHTSAEAHMTCIATVEAGDDVHFIDASNGGYALAARELKNQKKSAA